MKRILITGGAGFIGSTLALYLVEKNFEVTILDNLSPQIHGLTPEVNSPLYKSIINKTKFIKADVCDTQVLEKLVQEVDVIVHFAAETGTGQSMYNIDHYTKVNIQATAGLLDILTNKKHTVKKVVVASSRSIYGEGRYYHIRVDGLFFAVRVNVRLCAVCSRQMVSTRRNNDARPGRAFHGARRGSAVL